MVALSGNALEYMLSLAYVVGGALLGSPAGGEFLSAKDAATQVTFSDVPWHGSVCILGTSKYNLHKQHNCQNYACKILPDDSQVAHLLSVSQHS